MTINEIKQANKAGGGHFFDAAAKRFFNSRVSAQTFGPYFVTSEKDTGFYHHGEIVAAWGGRRRYTVRKCTDAGDIETVGEFCEFPTLSKALNAARRAYEAEKAGA